jgi:hypothetical protein
MHKILLVGQGDVVVSEGANVYGPFQKLSPRQAIVN